jgi:hypothetical protein
MTAHYDISLSTIDYNDETEYRSTIRKIFKMKDVKDENSDLDEITRDEMNFDTESMKKGHSQMYALLKDNLLFYDLFMKAASFMISEDPEVGFCIMLSYDYLKPFYPVLIKYKTVTIEDADYKKLYAILYY